MKIVDYSLALLPFAGSGVMSDVVAEVSEQWYGDHSDPEARDYEQVRRFTLADAMAASGDYFITLATRLDKLAQGLPQDSAEQIELENHIRTLFYMQDHYDLVSKHKRG